MFGRKKGKKVTSPPSSARVGTALSGRETIELELEDGDRTFFLPTSFTPDDDLFVYRGFPSPRREKPELVLKVESANNQRRAWLEG